MGGEARGWQSVSVKLASLKNWTEWREETEPDSRIGLPQPRFFTLNGSALQYYKSEFDTAKHPRGHIEVQVGHFGLAILLSPQPHNCLHAGEGSRSPGLR